MPKSSAETKHALEGSAPSLPGSVRVPGTDGAVPSSAPTEATLFLLCRRVRELPHAAVGEPLEHVEVAFAVHAHGVRRGELVFLSGLEFRFVHPLAIAKPGDAVVVLVEDGDET